MPISLSNVRLIRISKATKSIIENWQEGISLKNISGYETSALMCIVASDRWRLGFEHRRQANIFLKQAKPLYRSAISRYYYAMYHSMRACVYIHHRGDDFEGHSNLFGRIPSDFDTTINWSNTLKAARDIRNRADYDPYPKTDLAWRKDALTIKANADQLLLITRTYLQNKSCIV